ncbi:MAG: AAA domain-containing protein [Thermoplasmatales archaeon]|nr:AAA domain-containing protein [Thermoplasmatales archaeon]
MSETHKRPVYPFVAIVGQDAMKTALILNAVDPSIGGVLIEGERGTAKSTAVRSLALLLPEHSVMSGCVYSCDPSDPGGMCAACRAGGRGSETTRMRVVELPVSATEDKVVGTIDISAAIKSGEKVFEPGILAEANRNILYVDEVNLLNDHIVDVLLDAAAMGVNIVEREGVSYSHPSKFILVGTMNPEEGDLRPQLLDRFGLCVRIGGIGDPETRLEIVTRRLEFDEDPEGYVEKWSDETEKLAKRIVEAKERLPEVAVGRDILTEIVEMCVSLGIDGHRGDIAMVKASKALAAFRGKKAVGMDEVREAASMVLPHRVKKTPFSEKGFGPALEK